MRPACVAMLAVCALLALPGTGVAQEQSSGPLVTVNQILVPKTRGKLVNKGVAVNASCTPGCLLFVQLILPEGVAAKMGIGSPVVGKAITSADDSVPTWLRVPIRPKAQNPLRRYRGRPTLSIRVTAVP